MARLDIDLAPFRQARSGLAQLAVEQRRLDAEITTLQRDLGVAQRRRQATRRPLANRLAETRRARQALVERRLGLAREFDARADGAIAGRDPALLVESLDARQPIALLPLRIETRYLTRGNQRTCASASIRTTCTPSTTSRRRPRTNWRRRRPSGAHVLPMTTPKRRGCSAT